MAKKQSSNGAPARVKRAEAAIEQILKQEDVVITAGKIRLLFPDKDGRMTDGDLVSTKTLARLLNLPEGTLLMPQVQLEAKREAPAPAKS